MESSEHISIKVEYTFSSGLGAMEEQRYIKAVKATFYSKENADDEFCTKRIGETEFKILDLEMAKIDGYDIFDLFDTNEYTCRHGESFYDFEENDFKPKVYKHYNDNLINGNICLLESIYIIPDYRGLGLGPKLFKDLVLHFSRNASLFILQPHPLQFDDSLKSNADKKWHEFDAFEKSDVKAFEKLTSYYKSWGFEKISGIKDLMFLNAEIVNPKFDLINVNELKK